MSRHHRLHEDRRVRRVDARRHVEGCHILDFLLQRLGILVFGDGVLIDNAKDRLVVVLNLGPGLQRPK